MLNYNFSRSRLFSVTVLKLVVRSGLELEFSFSCFTYYHSCLMLLYFCEIQVFSLSYKNTEISYFSLFFVAFENHKCTGNSK